jgi:hypothetical protein
MLACGQKACLSKQAAHHVEDKSVKLIQVFQGLVSHVDHIGHRL